VADYDDALLDDGELQYRGTQCRRCGAPLLVSEGPHCGAKNPDGYNCAAITARLALHASGGHQSYARQRAESTVRGLFD
jgi:hypothetical protein